MSNQKSSKDRVANAGTWILQHHQDRASRADDMREFKDDCIATHESLVGAEAGAVLKVGAPTYKPVPPCPPVPLETDYENEADPTRAFEQAKADFSGKHAMWTQVCKSQQHHKEECENKLLPKLFVWILNRLDRDLRSRVEQDPQFSALEMAIPRDPAALMVLIETVMLRGDLDDEGFHSFELVRDLFSATSQMKEAQSLTDLVRMMRDKMTQLQSNKAYYCVFQNAGGDNITQYSFTEEFFVHLMFENLSKKYDQAKVEYVNSVSSKAINRITTFDALVKHFSTVRNVTTGEQVSATSLTTTKKENKGKNKTKPKLKSAKSGDTGKAKSSDRVFISGTHRNCRHCNGAHFDNACPDQQKKVKSTADPSQDEIAKVLAHLSAKKAAKLAKEAKALAATSPKYTNEEVESALAEYASSQL